MEVHECAFLFTAGLNRRNILDRAWMKETTGFSRVEFQFPPNQAGGCRSKRPSTFSRWSLPEIVRDRG